MDLPLLNLLRCPFCGTSLDLVDNEALVRDGSRVMWGVLGCQCCAFPILDGIPVLIADDPTRAAMHAMEAGHREEALASMLGLDVAGAGRLQALLQAGTATYRDALEIISPDAEGTYFFYRFSDPTFVVADAVVRAVAGTVLRGGGRALDICGGSGHLTRALVPLSSPAPVLADLFFPKIWLARRFTAPGAVPVCCDGNSPLPFVRGAFDFAMCADAFMFIWTKRQFVGEMCRAVDGAARATVLINHTHNQLVWSPSHGQALTPSAYRNLFEGVEPRVLAESRLFADVVKGDGLDLGYTDELEALNREAALTLIASTVSDVFAVHPIQSPKPSGGEWRINPLYQVREETGLIRATLHFPSPDYEDEYRACREYLPDEVSIDAAALKALQDGGSPESMWEWVRRRVVVELPRKYC